MADIRCSKCAHIYRSTEEIINQGGKVYQLGLSLMACCKCGVVWPCGRLWNATEVRALPFFEAEAKERQGQRTDINIPETIPECGEAREKAAEDFGTNAHYIQDVKSIASQSPEL